MKAVPLAIEIAVRFVVALTATAGLVLGILWAIIVVYDVVTHGSLDFERGPTSAGWLVLTGVLATVEAVGCWHLLRWAAYPSTPRHRRAAI